MDYVILAGYLKLIPSQLCRAFRRRILNIHPGLLPSFGGKGYYGIKVGGWRCDEMQGSCSVSIKRERHRAHAALVGLGGWGLLRASPGSAHDTCNAASVWRFGRTGPPHPCAHQWAAAALFRPPPPLPQVHQAVIASGARFSGPTIHFVDEEYDTGGCKLLWCAGCGAATTEVICRSLSLTNWGGWAGWVHTSSVVCWLLSIIALGADGQGGCTFLRGSSC